MKKSDVEAHGILSEFTLGRLSRRQALRALGLGGVAALGAAAWPLIGPTAFADEAGKKPGPGGIPLARPKMPVKLPLHGDPIKAGLKPESGTFKIYNYQDYLDQKVMDSFAKKYNVKVELTTFDSMDQAVTRMATGQVKPDSTNLTPDRMSQMVAGKLIRPLNHDYIPNLKANIWPSLQSPYYDVEAQYSVPYVVYTTGIGWRSDKIAEDVHKLDNPWSIFWNAQKYTGYVGVLDDSREALALGMFYKGKYDINTEDPADINEALAALEAMVPICHPKIDIKEYQQLGDATSWLHQSWSGDLISCAINYLAKGTDPNVLQFWAGGVGKSPVQNDTWVLLAHSQKPVLGHLWLNHLLDEQVAYDNFVGFTAYQPPQNKINADDLIKSGTIPETLRTAILTPEALGPDSIQHGAMTPAGLKLWQNAYAKFNSGT
ncbi:MAG TPA: extracellular solute-binding protein [Dongiaceae bacterium]